MNIPVLIFLFSFVAISNIILIWRYIVFSAKYINNKLFLKILLIIFNIVMILIIILPRSNGNGSCGCDIIINNINSNSKIIINLNFVYNLTNNEVIKLSNLHSAGIQIGIKTQNETKYFYISEEKHYFYILINKHKIKLNINDNNVFISVSKFSPLKINTMTEGIEEYEIFLETIDK